MRTTFFLTIFLLVGQALIADGSDKITMRLNGTFIFEMNEHSVKEIALDLQVGDTLSFTSWTDWGGLEDSRLTISTETGSELIRLNRLPDRQYNATFYVVTDANLLNKKLRFTFLYDPISDMKCWNFLNIKNP